MKLSLSTYNGSTISTYSARILKDVIGAEASLISVTRASSAPTYGGKSFKPDEFDVQFSISSTEGAARQTQVEALGQLFDTHDNTLHNLVALDTNDSNRSYYIECTPSKPLQLDGGVASVRMWTPDPVWKRSTASSGTVVIPGTAGASGTIVNNGNVDCYPTITITPGASAGYRQYRYHIIAYNPTNRGLPNYPLNICGTAFAGSAEVGAGRLQADGDDIMVSVDGSVVERWGGSVNSAATRVWIVLNFSPKIEGTLQSALTASGNTAITLANTAANTTAMQKLPARGLVLIDNECIAYTAKNVLKRTLTISDAGRGAKDTTAASHAAGATLRWIQYDIVMLTGNASVTAPVQTDTRKPCFSVDNSTNTNWRWDSADSVFCDLAGLRAGGWKPSRAVGVYSDWYSGNQGTAGTDPATDMGFEINSYQSGGVWKAETAKMYWTFQNNAAITNISALGEAYRTATSTPWPTAKLQSSVDGATWAAEYSLSAPGTAATWANWTQAGEALPTGTRYVRFVFAGAVNAVANAVARYEVNLGASGSMGVTLNSSNVPQIIFGSRVSNAEINCTITNSTTAEALSYSYPLKLNQTLTLDTTARTVELEQRLLAPPDLDSVRQEWLRLQPGNNVISYADTTGAAGTMIFTYRDRKNV